MSETSKLADRAEAGPAIPADTVVPKTAPTEPISQPRSGGTFALRRPIPQWLAVILGLLCIAAVFGVWWGLTRGPSEERILGYSKLPSPEETFDKGQLHELWFDRALTRNIWASTRRVVLGFLLAAAVGIPLGILCGCFPWVNSFLAPINLFGRNIPIAALIPLTLSLFGIEELQKVMFIFIACVAFVMMDTATAVADVSGRYIDTAYTLGASRRQIIMNVLVPLAMPRIFNSLRLLFGLAFGYIMLAEMIKAGTEDGGLGHIINLANRFGRREPILLVLMVIPAVALGIDRVLYMLQKSLFPYQYASSGLLHDMWRGLMRGAESFKHVFVSPHPLDEAQKAALRRPSAPQSSGPAAST
jgi:ABC-type nitrate/sulfonate/bicarbonate transport system permease component